MQMVSDSPPFWWTKADWRAYALSPVSFLYGRIAGYRMANAPRTGVSVPVICAGNFTAGGAGKTPTALALAEAAKAKGLVPGFLSRGYGGSIDVTTVVDPDHHRADAVGDEPLLLARTALTVIARRRLEGAERLIREGATLIIMDDGFQSARLAIDFALLVVDSHRSTGNGFVIPAGPVRAPMDVQLRHATALLKVGDGDNADYLIRRAARAGLGVMEARLMPKPMPELAGRRVLAFAGIADPGKFFRTVESLGAEIAESRSFPDHSHLEEDQMRDLLETARRQALMLVTTAKDHVRLAGHGGTAAELAAAATVIAVEMQFDDPRAPGMIIDRAVDAARKRLLGQKTS
ncbi:tetraacyldisaccharide 4'-kinase [Gellertiella hungarica]|uniref:Tetraacyldisaccharide 4'-kinase n=2 Tax=Gellertiella hungarica TaxID=1572859 RepID=A0A7W6J5D7_9HYPH|nr:tetraacyldisaccharide 4'-kinase [Gellertiella hungarica]